MKPREPRRKVLIKARMRVGAGWNDVCILDISTRGLAMQAAAPPPRGTYLEIRRGGHRITARVMWARHHRFGVQTQDQLAIDDLVDHPERCPPEAGGCAEDAIADRRRAPRSTAVRHEASRMLSRTMEFAAIGAFAVGAAVVTFGSVAEALEPLAEASAALTPQ